MALQLPKKSQEVVTTQDLLLHQDSLLIGYKEIGRYCKCSHHTLRRWMTKYHFPIAIFNKRAYSSRALIDNFLLTICHLQSEVRQEKGETDE